MNFKDLIIRNRSYRRFDESYKITTKQLTEMIDCARLSASSANLQTNKFYLSNSSDINNSIFSCLAWAGYLKNWKGPEPGEKPSAYILILADKNIHPTIEVDVGIAAQSILLAATEMGLGGCMIGSVSRGKLQKLLKIPHRFEIPLVIALGKPTEKVVIEIIKEDNIKYWRDANEIHHVPKRTLEELIINTF
jgi:nitroreductase